MAFDLHKAIILRNLKTKHRRRIKLYIFGILWQDKQFDTILEGSEHVSIFLPMWNSQGQWQLSWKYHIMWHIRKMLLMLCNAKPRSFNILRAMDELSCPTITQNLPFWGFDYVHAVNLSSYFRCLYLFGTSNNRGPITILWYQLDVSECSSFKFIGSYHPLVNRVTEIGLYRHT